MKLRDRQNGITTSGYLNLEVEIVAGQVILNGNLHIPSQPAGTVLFAHGSGSGRLSPRNQSVASSLHKQGMATLLLDLLTPNEEARDRNGAELRFDVDLLTERLLHATEWITHEPKLECSMVGLFGASTGAAAALSAAAATPHIATVVSRGGRPDLAGAALDHVRIPVLLIVGSEDRTVLNLNRQALAHLPAEKKLEVIPGATHLFEEQGALERVADLAGDWFKHHLAQTGSTIQAA